MRISGKTRVLGLIGYPVEHSLSPSMHNAAFEHLGLDCCYVTFSVRPELLGDAVRAIRALNLKGVNVTVPHKEKVIPLLDLVDEEASFIGAVNTILNDDGVLKGFNTDGKGFMESLKDANIDVKDKRVVIIGAGGASRAIGFYLCKEAKVLGITDIDQEKAQRLVNDLKRLKDNVYHIERLTDLKDIDIVINATPIGLKDTDPSPIDISLLTGDKVVCDLIYKDTFLLRSARQRGCKTLNGLGMLLYQGVLAFEIWTGMKAPVEVMREALLKG
ncbi:MAG: shikimate dehydrogenase [Thermodesulfovibrionales bacterium]